MKYLKNLLIAFDQLINTICLGFPDETLSSRAWRESEVVKHKQRKWLVVRIMIDILFFIFERDHCKKSYQSEVEQKQQAKEIKIDGSN